MAIGHRAKLTYADYAALPDDGRRWELIDGELTMTPAPKTRHQEILRRLVVSFSQHLERHGGGRVFMAPFDVVLADTVVVQPDLVFIADAEAHRVTEANLEGPPTLVTEVVSDPLRDLVRKRELFARFTVPEYWAVHPDLDRVEVFRLASRTYPGPTVVEPGGQLSTELLPGLVIDVATLLAR